MANYDLVTDVSSWNPDTLSFFNTLAKKNVKATIVKLTEGTTYQNPKATNQIRNSWASGLHAHGYHYARFTTTAQAKAEALFFAKVAKARGLDKTSVLAADVEDNGLPKAALTPLVKTFLTTLQGAGYPKVDLYTMASWVWYRRLDLAKLPRLNLWIANYGVSQPGVDRVGTWQFTSNWQGLRVDMSDDFSGYYTRLTTVK